MFYQIVMTLLTLSIFGGIIGAFNLILRLLFKKRVSQIIFMFFWGIMFLRLITPFFFKTPYSPFNQLTVDDKIFYNVSRNISRECPVWEIIFLIWLSVAILLLLSVCFLYIFICRYYTLSGKRLKHANYNEMVERLKLKQKITLLKSCNVDSPLLIGIIHPKIILPDSLHDDDSQVFRHILIHEGIHIKRYDNLQKMLSLFCLCIHWFNPVIWVCYFAFSRDIEASCDEKVIKVIGKEYRAQYANSLLDLATARRGWHSAMVVGFGESSIKKRVVAIMSQKRISKILTILITVLFVSITTLFATVPLENSNRTSLERSKSKFHTIILSPPSSDQSSNFDSAKTGPSGPSTLPNYKGESLTLALIK